MNPTRLPPSTAANTPPAWAGWRDREPDLFGNDETGDAGHSLESSAPSARRSIGAAQNGIKAESRVAATDLAAIGRRWEAIRSAGAYARASSASVRAAGIGRCHY